jgi:hypothetical protein
MYHAEMGVTEKVLETEYQEDGHMDSKQDGSLALLLGKRRNNVTVVESQAESSLRDEHDASPATPGRQPDEALQEKHAHPISSQATQGCSQDVNAYRIDDLLQTQLLAMSQDDKNGLSKDKEVLAMMKEGGPGFPSFFYKNKREGKNRSAGLAPTLVTALQKMVRGLYEQQLQHVQQQQPWG